MYILFIDRFDRNDNLLLTGSFFEVKFDLCLLQFIYRFLIIDTTSQYFDNLVWLSPLRRSNFITSAKIITGDGPNEARLPCPQRGGAH